MELMQQLKRTVYEQSRYMNYQISRVLTPSLFSLSIPPTWQRVDNDVTTPHVYIIRDDGYPNAVLVNFNPLPSDI